MAGKKLERIANSIPLRAMRRGLIMEFPIILVGCFACVLGNFPVPAYLSFITSFGGGFLKMLFDILNNCCVGAVSLWTICFVGYAYGTSANQGNAIYYPVVSLCAYLIFVYGSVESAGVLTYFSSRWTFTALVVTLLTSALYARLFRRGGKRSAFEFSSGSDSAFRLSLRQVAPIAMILAAFGILHMGIRVFFGDTDFYNLGDRLTTVIFSHIKSGFWGGLLFMLMVHGFWFFGIHGSNMMENAAQAFEATLGTGAICTKTFIDVFVLMGGCGVSLGIIAAILLSAKGRRNRSLAALSIFPGLFNINETIIYGMPVFFNRIMLMPFLLTPLAVFSVSYGATALGLVPHITSAVTWQMPVFFSGYMATGSIAGSILQAVNLCIAAAIYTPFIKILERKQTEDSVNSVSAVVGEIREAEAGGFRPNVLTAPGLVGDTARGIAFDLRSVLESAPDQLDLFYQPQMNYDSTVAGAEALLRWKHPVAGYIYPPLVIDLANECRLIDELGLLLIERTAAALEKIAASALYPISLSVNISAPQLQNPHFVERVKAILDKYYFGSCRLVFELTEQISLSSDPMVSRQLRALTELSIDLSMDDFGMGHSSLMYLQDQKFACVKLDGSLVTNVLDNDASRQVIASMADFSARTGIKLVAEYVETAEQVEALHKLGCDCYQGYFYSKAVPLPDAVAFLREKGAIV